MTSGPLDCIGTDGKHDFQPSGPVIHAPVELKRRTPESEARYYAEKITELVLTQSELAKAVAERNALAKAMRRIRAGEIPISQLFAAEILRKLEAGEFRKHGA